MGASGQDFVGYITPTMYVYEGSEVRSIIVQHSSSSYVLYMTGERKLHGIWLYIRNYAVHEYAIFNSPQIKIQKIPGVIAINPQHMRSTQLCLSVYLLCTSIPEPVIYNPNGSLCR